MAKKAAKARGPKSNAPPKAPTPSKAPVIMISSTVYGVEELLERIYALLTKFGYEVWCSHTGTMPVKSSLTAFENCLECVTRCDLFLGLITPLYGSGKDGDEISITHQELRKAIELKKPRWLLAHENVVFARSLLAQLGHDSVDARKGLAFKRSRVMDDLRVIDMYDEAILDQLALKERKGNWAQKYATPEDAMRYASAQFRRFQEVESFLAEHLADSKAVMDTVSKGKGAGT